MLFMSATTERTTMTTLELIELLQANIMQEHKVHICAERGDGPSSNQQLSELLDRMEAVTAYYTDIGGYCLTEAEMGAWMMKHGNGRPLERCGWRKVTNIIIRQP